MASVPHSTPSVGHDTVMPRTLCAEVGGALADHPVVRSDEAVAVDDRALLLRAGHQLALGGGFSFADPLAVHSAPVTVDLTAQLNWLVDRAHLKAAADDPRPGISGEEMLNRLREATKDRQEPAIWEKRSRR